jgi:MFS family permease
VAFLLTAVWAGKNLHNYGRKHAVKSSILLMSAATMMFCLASKAKHVFIFYVGSCIARVMQGAAAGIIEVAVPAIISQQWPENNEVY